jgi:hypothetical protein
MEMKCNGLVKILDILSNFDTSIIIINNVLLEIDLALWMAAIFKN